MRAQIKCTKWRTLLWYNPVIYDRQDSCALRSLLRVHRKMSFSCPLERKNVLNATTITAGCLFANQSAIYRLSDLTNRI